MAKIVFFFESLCFLDFNVGSMNGFAFKIVEFVLKKGKNLLFCKTASLGYAMPYPRGAVNHSSVALSSWR